MPSGSTTALSLRMLYSFPAESLCVLLSDDNTWLTRGHVKVMCHLDLSKLLKERCKEAGPVIPRDNHSTITVDQKLDFVAGC